MNMRPRVRHLSILLSMSFALVIWSATVSSRAGDFKMGANDFIHAITVQADGKILIGGNFTSINGKAHHGIARLNADGSLDGRFNPNANGAVSSIVEHSDRKILIGGSFDRVGGEVRKHFSKLLDDGSLDGDFINLDGGVGADVIAVQADGKILIGGEFPIQGAGGILPGLVRLNQNGSLDMSYPNEFAPDVSVINVRPDNKVLVAGYSNFGWPEIPKGIARLNLNGSLDTSFNPDVDSSVSSLAVQSDGKILIVGFFRSVDGFPRNKVARLNIDGSLDDEFVPVGPLRLDALVNSIALQADGKVIIGGSFDNIGGAARNNIARINVDGSIDEGFNPDFNDFVGPITIQGDGKILVGGAFTKMRGVTQNRIARLNADGSIDDSFVLAVNNVITPVISLILEAVEE